MGWKRRWLKVTTPTLPECAAAVFGRRCRCFARQTYEGDNTDLTECTACCCCTFNACRGRYSRKKFKCGLTFRGVGLYRKTSAEDGHVIYEAEAK